MPSGSGAPSGSGMPSGSGIGPAANGSSATWAIRSASACATAAAWAAAYVALHALPDFGTAMLYSLNAITAYGHSSTSLAYHWALMGALEALNGLLMFGLTTAFLFAVAQHVWPISRVDKRHYHRLQGRPDQSGCQDHASE